MNKLIISLLSIVASASVLANTCSIIIPTAPGGTNDLMIRTIQKQNKNITVEYFPGAFNSGAINKVKQNPEIGIFSSMIMFSPMAPIRDPNLDLQQVVVTFPLGIFSAKHKNFDEILSNRKVNIGVSFLGAPGHLAALELKNINPNIEIVAFGADVKAFSSIVSGDIDYYITGVNIMEQLIALKVNVVSASTEITVGNKKINTASWFGLWTSKDATEAQRKNIIDCFNQGINSASINDLNSDYVKVVNLTGAKKDAMLKEFINTSEKYVRR
jgi:tripartite-type tricarboxylate transporter receptor subunit TctC